MSRRLIALGLSLGIASASAGCTSIPLMPVDGPVAKLNLATVGYLSEREASLRGDLSQEVEAAVAAEIASALAVERARIDEVEALVALEQGRIAKIEASLGEQLKAVETLLARVTSGETSLREVAVAVGGRLDALDADAEALRSAATQLDLEVQTLPRQTLERLSAALATHLADNDEAAAPRVFAAPNPVPAVAARNAGASE